MSLDFWLLCSSRSGGLHVKKTDTRRPIVVSSHNLAVGALSALVDFVSQFTELRIVGSCAMEALDTVVKPIREFANNSVRLVKKCQKPDRREFSKVTIRTGFWFVGMGFVGFFVKIIFIPINQIIVGSV